MRKISELAGKILSIGFRCTQYGVYCRCSETDPNLVMVFPDEIRPETKIRKPSLGDFKKIFEAETFTDIWPIPIFNVVRIAEPANVGSTPGTILYFIVIIPTLGIDPGILILPGFGNMWQGIMGLIH